MKIIVFEIATSLKIDCENHKVQFKAITSAIPHEKGAELCTQVLSYDEFDPKFIGEFYNLTKPTIKVQVASPFPEIYDTYLLIQPQLIQEAKNYFSNVPSSELIRSVASMYY
jgi:hypothetical protein